MDIKKLTRDKAATLKALEKGKNGEFIAKQDLSIVFPTRYRNRGLASLENQTRVLAMFAIVVGNKFATMMVNATIDLQPQTQVTFDYNDENFTELRFKAGQVIAKSLKVVQSNILVYYISDHYYSRGDIPWFISYGQVAELFDTSTKHAGANLHVDPAVFEGIAASLARDPKDRTKFIRHSLRTQADFANAEPTYISLKNIELGATNTTAKLMGNFYHEGLASALVTQTERLEGIEALLRK